MGLYLGSSEWQLLNNAIWAMCPLPWSWIVIKPLAEDHELHCLGDQAFCCLLAQHLLLADHRGLCWRRRSQNPGYDFLTGRHWPPSSLPWSSSSCASCPIIYWTLHLLQWEAVHAATCCINCGHHTWLWSSWLLQPLAVLWGEFGDRLKVYSGKDHPRNQSAAFLSVCVWQ